MEIADSPSKIPLLSRYDTNRTLVASERDRLVRARDRLQRVLRERATGDEGVVNAEVNGLVDGCFRIWHGIDQVISESTLHQAGPADPFDLWGAMAGCDIDSIEHGSVLLKQWAIDEVRAVVALFDRGAGVLGGWSTPARQLALYDTMGQGRIAEVHGHLAEAKHLAIYVPGMGTDLWDFDRVAATRTEVIRSRASALVEGAPVSAITWLGYDAPRDLDVIGAAHEELAKVGSEALSRFLLEMVAFAPADVHVTVLAHSYGSVLAGLAARDYGLAAHELVVLGSPGMGVDTAEALMLMPGGRVWAAQARDDPVTWLPRLEDHHLHLHGPSPTEAGFGARVLTVSSRGHSSYFEDGQCLDALAAITVGREPKSECS